MNNNTLLSHLLHGTATALANLMLIGLLLAPLTSSAEPSAISLAMVRQEIAATDARFKIRDPFIRMYVTRTSIEGMNVASWGPSKALKKISVDLWDERGRTLQSFYWKDGVLIGAREQRVDYGDPTQELPNDQPLPTKVVKDELLELAGDVVLRRQSFGRTVPTSDAEAKASTTVLKTDARSFRRQIFAAEKSGYSLWSCAREQGRTCLAYAHE
jgi:HAMP domain-containing protein